jgi:hypothetical protein
MIVLALKAVAFLRRVPKMLSPQSWAVVGALVAFLLFGAYCAHRAAEGERAAQASRQAELDRKASAARETAADERLNDTLTTEARERERHDATASLPDTRPSARRIARACVQLRQQRTPERELPVVCRSAG